MLVRTLARICDDPYDPVFSVPVRRCPAGASLTWATSVSSSSSPMRRRDWFVFITWCGPVSDHHIAAVGRTCLALATRSWKCYTPASVAAEPCSMPDYRDLRTPFREPLAGTTVQTTPGT